MDHEPITVTILSSVRAAKETGWDEGDLLWLAKQEGVLIDANDPTHAAAFGISPHYLPAAWVEEVKSRPTRSDEG
jgi:hypothetical protein